MAALAPDPLRAAAVRYTLGHVLMRQDRFLDAHLRPGRDQTAESALLTMERVGPDWLAYQELPRVLVGELLTRGRPSARLRGLVHRLSATRAPQLS